LIKIAEAIQRYHRGIENDMHHRYRSWEHCYSFFHRSSPESLQKNRETAALQLGFYLASWGMYRGSSFLLQHAYTVHLGVIDCIIHPEFIPLWNTEFGSSPNDTHLIPIIWRIIEGIREAYAPFGQPSDTLVTKVILGTIGCLPACDRYFISGFRCEGLAYSQLNERFVGRVHSFCTDHLKMLRQEQLRILQATGANYPLMKLIDMYFWQVGYENSPLVISSVRDSE
jgi:hypothetical protein